MTSLKYKISSFLAKAKQALGFFLFHKSKGRFNQIDIDKKLVYSLSPNKIPSGQQLKYLGRFLNPRELMIIKISIAILLINLAYLGFILLGKYLKTAPISGGSYSEAVIGYPKNINPLYAASRDVDNDIGRLIYSSLFRYDTFGALQSDLALDYVISSDYKEYLITIKDGVKWHNGENLSVDDIIYTFRLIQDETYRSPLRDELIGVSVEKVNENQIKFVLPEPYSPFLELLTFGIMPKSIWEKIGPEAAALADLNIKPIGSGPYKFKSLAKNKDGDLKEYNLEVNQEYYGSKPFIETITFKFFTDHVEAISNFNNGYVDGLSVLPLDYRSSLSIKDSTQVHELLRPQIFGIFFNQEKNKSLEDKSIRVALEQAIDKEALINDLFYGAYQIADSPILKTSFAYGGNISRYLNDAEAARSALTDKNVNFKLTVIDVNNNTAVASFLKNNWESVGVTVELNIIPLEQALEVVRNRDFEALLYGQSVGGDPDVFAFWHSTQVGAKGLNLSGYNNEEIDKLLLEARGAINSEQRIEKYQRFQEVLTSEVPAIFLYSPTHTYVQNRRVKGFEGQVIFEPADRFSGISNWYIKTKKFFSK